MQTQHIALQDTGRFSKLICDYLNQDSNLQPFYGHYPSLENIKDQLELKKEQYSEQTRNILVKALQNQYANMNPEKAVAENLKLLAQENTFTVTTGHQLCLMTGPLYFIYKIISTINLCTQLKKSYPKANFVPVYWMASEDHDFEEVSTFQFQDKKIRWNREPAGAVGQLPLTDLQAVLDLFEKHIENQPEAEIIKQWLEKSYRKAADLSQATFRLVDQLFGTYGLVVIEPNKRELKKLFIPVLKEELATQETAKSVRAQIKEIQSKYSKKYTAQVNPREINLFYLTPKGRYRIEKHQDGFILNGTEQFFKKDQFFKLMEDYPERFSPNVILRPVYQEIILPNLCYVGGGGEIAYWFQLKQNFDRLNVIFPALLVRNSALLYSKKSRKKIDNLNLSPSDLFLNRNALINKKIRQISNIDLDLSFLRDKLQEQFTYLKSLVTKTDRSFEGAVAAQEKKQNKGIEQLEKRLIKAQKRVLSDQVQRLVLLHEHLFPNDQLQERNLNFVTFYIEMGGEMIPTLLKSLDPLNPDLTLIEY